MDSTESTYGVFYHHERLGRNAVTVALELVWHQSAIEGLDGPTGVAYAVACCSDKDSFVRATGRRIARRRLHNPTIIDEKGREHSVLLRHELPISLGLAERLGKAHNRAALYDAFELCLVDLLSAENRPNWYTAGWREKVRAEAARKREEKQEKFAVQGAHAPMGICPSPPAGAGPAGIPYGHVWLPPGFPR